MTYIDIFNGDADGICALTQLHHAYPRKATLVTGVKRNIQLVDTVNFRSDDQITVLDISLDKNINGVRNALAMGAQVFYVDHHYSGIIPEHKNLKTLIDTSNNTCTSLLINQNLKGQFLEWALVGAFGDNLITIANDLGKQSGLDELQLSLLEKLGRYINYNGYGSTIEDLHFHPERLFNHTRKFSSPFDFIQNDRETFEKLEQGYNNDMALAKNTKNHFQNNSARLFILPNTPWARRVSGVFSNSLANEMPSIAHAVLTENSTQSGYVVSVRAPLKNKTGADTLCREFPTGGGRKSAAGINNLPTDQLRFFTSRFSEFFSTI